MGKQTADNTVVNAAENAVSRELRTIKALVVTSVAKSFRRLGLAFTREAVHLDPSLLSKDDVQALKSDPNLVVTEAKVTVPAPLAVAPPTPVVVPVEAPAAEPSAQG